jgi:hypothetical protein
MSKVYLFNGGQYSRYDIKQDAVDPGYPLSVADFWPGLPASGVDAAVNWGNGVVYFFAGHQYYRYSAKLDQVDAGYPLPIAGNWPGLTLDAVDACVNWGNGKAYFFRGGQYWRYDIKKDSVDPGYPLPIAGNWPGLTLDAVDGGINWGNGKAYFFRSDQYWRYDIKKDSVDSGYPLPIAGNWPGLFTSAVRAPVMLGYAGFDRITYPGAIWRAKSKDWLYPGDDMMTALWNQTNLRWCGFYLAPAPNQGSGTSWMTRRPFLTGLGWGLAPIYLGEQQSKVCDSCTANPSSSKGSHDAKDAIDLATTAGFPAGSVIYLDIETWSPINSPMRDYYTSWVVGIIAGGFVPGVYCPHVLARQLRGFDSRPVFWSVKGHYPSGASASYSTSLPAPEPLLCGIEFTTMWQLSLSPNNNPTVLRLSPTQTVSVIDFDSASVPDPSLII